MTSYQDFLQASDFLADAPTELVTRIARAAQPLEVPAGREIFADGVPGDAMYFIVRGEVAIEKQGLRFLVRRPGDYVGEMALIDDAPRSAAAVAIDDVTLLRWGKEDFLETLRTDGWVAYRICRVLSGRIRQDVERETMLLQDRDRAAALQRTMLPDASFRGSMVEIAASCRQADDVGGDYFDYVPFGEDRLALVVADGQGHGFAAALLVAILKTRLHVEVWRDPAPAAVVSELNRAISANLSEIFTATCCYLLFDRNEHSLRFCNGGHIPQYLYRAAHDELVELHSRNLLLGFPGQEDYPYEEESVDWESGDLLVLCTDGVTEALNAEDEEYGAERLRAAILAHTGDTPEQIERALRADLAAFCGAVPFKDDVTLLVARLA